MWHSNIFAFVPQLDAMLVGSWIARPGLKGKNKKKRKIMTNRCSSTLCVFCLRRNFEGEKFRFFFIRNLFYRMYFRTFTEHFNFNKVQLEEILALIIFSYNYQ